MKLRLVASQTALIFDAAGDALIDDARQALSGQPFDVADAQCVADLHGSHQTVAGLNSARRIGTSSHGATRAANDLNSGFALCASQMARLTHRAQIMQSSGSVRPRLRS